MPHRTFDPNDHTRFAELSGDFNPIHMDPIAARRTQIGTPIIHGIHSLLWLLDCMASGLPLPRNPTCLRAQFRKPIYVGDEASIDITLQLPGSVRARILVDSVEVVVATLEFRQRSPEREPQLQSTASARYVPGTIPANPTFEQAEHCSGWLDTADIARSAESLFPFTVQYLGAQRVAALIATSRLVGMIVPGLHSLFAGLEVCFCEPREGNDTLHFGVTATKRQRQLIRIGIRGGGLRGSLETMRRAPPTMQPSMTSIAPLVVSGSFRGSTALVLGGSRGLGELTAKLVAAGGGRTIITYATGQLDAETVAAEIRAAGAECTTAHFDVLQPAGAQLAALAAMPTHVYYFATPPIARRKQGLFDVRRFGEFNTFYMTGFSQLMLAFLRHNSAGVRVFYPSSVFVDTRPAEMTEYAMSKAAAEVLCADMCRFLPNLDILVRRLPRLATDQTSAVMNEIADDAIATMLPIVQEMHASL
jgi:acyl dehydratase